MFSFFRALTTSFEVFKETYPHLYKSKDHIFVHPITSQLADKYKGKPIGTFKKQWEAFLRWTGLTYEKTGQKRARPLYSCRHYYFEQRIINSDAPLIMLAKNELKSYSAPFFYKYASQY